MCSLNRAVLEGTELEAQRRKKFGRLRPQKFAFTGRVYSAVKGDRPPPGFVDRVMRRLPPVPGRERNVADGPEQK